MQISGHRESDFEELEVVASDSLLSILVKR